MSNYEEKCSRLLAAMETYTKEDCVIAFSGGADSSLILKLACLMAEKQGNKVHAVTVHTSLHPMNDLKLAEQTAKEMGAIHRVIYVDEFQEAGIAQNPPDRCYRCKKYLFEQLKVLAGELGSSTILEGTNEDDLHEYRPGIQALRELEIISPLADAGMTKEEVRRLAAEYQIPTAGRASAPCLATRFPYGTVLSVELMQKVEAAETMIKELGFYNVRLRIHDEIARIEIDEEAVPGFIENRNKIIEFLKKQGFHYITLDLEGFRSGSMDISITSRQQSEIGPVLPGSCNL